MKVNKSFLILCIFIMQLSIANAQIVGLYPDVVPFSSQPGNCMWLTNQTADQVKTFYLNSATYKPEKIVPLADNTSKGFRLYYRHQGSLGWQKYWIKITTVNLNNCVAYYKDSNPEILMIPFEGLKAQVDAYDHSSSDFKKVYKQYQHLACKLYKVYTDDKGYSFNEMDKLLKKYSDALVTENQNLMASEGNGAVAPEQTDAVKKDNWDYWLRFLEELDSKGYTTLIEYSTCPIH